MHDDRDTMTRAGLNLIQQALTIYDRDLRLAVCNRRFQEMFALPDALVTPGADFEATIRYLARRGDYGDVGDVERFVSERVETARAFEPHYMERTRANGRTISVEGTPLPQGGWVTVYTDITGSKRQEALLRARSEELSDQLLAYSEDLATANRELQATITALEEAKRQITEAEARTRLTAEMMPAHIAHVDRDRRYTYSNRRLSSVMPGSRGDLIGVHAAEVLGAETWAVIAPYLDRAYAWRAVGVRVHPRPQPRAVCAWHSPPTRSRAASTSCRWTSPAKARRAPPCNRRSGARWRRSSPADWRMISPTC